MKTLYVNYTPIPAQVPRQLAIDILHSHGEVITLNPLVLEHHPIKPPRDAPEDEYYSTWYEIIQQISFIPGIGKLGTGKVSFKGCFHDMPWGLQTHTYIPMGIELQHKWQVRGSQPGEAAEPREIGSKAPTSGLYLQENVEIQCNALTISFVKKELKAASKVMIDRMMKKAELLDAGVLQAMFEEGKLKTFNPNDKTQPGINAVSPRSSAMGWRPMSSISMSSQGTSSVISPSNEDRKQSGPIEMLGDTHFNVYPAHGPGGSPGAPQELMGDTASPNPNVARWSHNSSRDSHTNGSSVYDSRSSTYQPSPNPEAPSYGELPGQQNMLSPQTAAAPPQSPYNPQDYARYSTGRYS